MINNMRKMLATQLSFLLIISLTATVLALEIEKPSATYTISKREETNKCDGNAAVGLGIDIGTYHIGDPEYAPHDWLNLKIVTTANTREIIDYGVQDTSYSWYELGDECQIPEPGASYDDDELIGLVYPISPYKIRFYGGPKSGEYDRDTSDIAYISTNGFLCFYLETQDGSAVGDWKDYPYNIPDERGPNAFIAPFWTDLKPNQATKIKADIVTWGPGVDNALCITWENIPNVNGQLQTFQLVVGFPRYFWQSEILFQYKKVTPSSTVKIGIECQTGKKGVSYNPLNVSNGKALGFLQTSFYAFIRYLTIKIIKVTTPADIYIDRHPNRTRGTNVKFENQEPDPNVMFALSLSGDITLLVLGHFLSEVHPLMGFMIGGAVIFYEIVSYAASKMVPVDLQELEIKDETDVNFAKIPAYPSHEENPSLSPATVVDADFGINVDWVLKDQGDHEIKLVAELEYFICSASGSIVDTKTIQTDEIPIIFKRDAGNCAPEARYVMPGMYLAYVHFTVDVYDFYNVTVPANKWICLTMNMDSTLYADLYLYKPNGEDAGKSEKAGSTAEYISYHAVSSGDYTIKVKASSGGGLYELEIAIFDFELKVETRLTSGGEITDVKVWVNYELKYSPLAIYTSETDHTVEVESTFIRIIELDIYEYTFVRWEDHSTNNPRTITIEENTILTAYYKVKYVGSISSIGDV